ncbi:Symplekin-like protein [Drosera capensis]
MVGIMAATTYSRETMATMLNSVDGATAIPSKLEQLRKLKDALVPLSDTVLLSEFLSGILKLHADRFSPIRRVATEMIGELGSRYLEFLPEIVPTLMNVMEDDVPAVARQAISSGTALFCSTLAKVAVQGLHTNELDDELESAWAWMLKLKEKIYSIAFQPGSDGRRLIALKYVEAVILIYTPDPNGAAEPPLSEISEGNLVQFNISWIRRGHPLLKVGDLSIEASQSLGFLLDQLRYPVVKSQSTSMIIVVVNCLSAIAKKRPSFYGRILPVLLGLDPSNSAVKTAHVYGVQHALKNAFVSCLRCKHPSATPWRDRLLGALKDMNAGNLSEIAPEVVINTHGIVKEERNILKIKMEDVTSDEASVPSDNSAGRKRSGGQEIEEDDTPKKRGRIMPVSSEGLAKQSITDPEDMQVASSAQQGPHEGGDSEPVQQLVAVFGALVAQGEKAVGSLDILISNVSADLLAEVVMENMRNLPSIGPKSEELETLSSDRLQGLEGYHADAVFHRDRLGESVVEGAEEVLGSVVRDGSLLVDRGNSTHVSEFEDVKNLDSIIPGLSAPGDGLTDIVISPSLVSSHIETATQDHVGSFGRQPLSDQVPSSSTDKSEERSPKYTAGDINSGAFVEPTSFGSIQQLVLPKMSAPVIDLSEKQKDFVQSVAFMRIIEAYKHVAAAGGAQLQFSLLACLGVEFPLDLDPWTPVQDHILSDYLNHEGHELTLSVLYRLYREAEENRDFFSSTTATSVYDMFLLKVAEAVRDSFPASDKSLSRLLGEVPYLPKSTFELLQCLCSPTESVNDDKELHGGDRVTQGLTVVWNLIMLRPALRDGLLKIALQSAVHHMDEVRQKAIRLVANKLYPLSPLSQQIEEFAEEMLRNAVIDSKIVDAVDGGKSSGDVQKNSEVTEQSKEQPLTEVQSKDNVDGAASDTSNSSIHVSETWRCMSLYFALCTKKHSLLRQIFVIYNSSVESVKQVIHQHMPILLRTIGASSSLLEIVSDPPDGAHNLVMRVLHILIGGGTPPPILISTIKNLYESKGMDVEILFPILPFLSKEEVLLVFPRLVSLPAENFQVALGRLLEDSAGIGPVLSPAEVTDACNACFEQRQIFTQQVIANVLNHLVEQIPLPLLFMRTVLQAIGAFPALVEFILDILFRLVNKQIWKYPKLWVGFLRCALFTQPNSFEVLLKLPAEQLGNALTKSPALKAPLIAYSEQPHVRSSLSRYTLIVLGLESEPQVSSQREETVLPDAVEASSLDKPSVSESKEPSTTS